MTKTLFNRLLCNWGDGWRMDIYASGWWDGNMFTTDIRKFTYMTSPLSPCCSLPFGLIQENRNCRPCWPLSIGVTPWCLLHSSTKTETAYLVYHISLLSCFRSLLLRYWSVGQHRGPRHNSLCQQNYHTPDYHYHHTTVFSKNGILYSVSGIFFSLWIITLVRVVLVISLYAHLDSFSGAMVFSQRLPWHCIPYTNRRDGCLPSTSRGHIYTNLRKMYNGS